MNKILLTLIGCTIFISSCNNENPNNYFPDFTTQHIGGKSFRFTPVNEGFNKLVWTVEGNEYTADSIDYTFSKEGVFAVKMLAYFDVEEGVEDTVSTTKYLEIKEQYPIVIISTEFGEISCYLYQSTPKHQENFIKLAEEGFYDGTTFHRIIKGFMIQGGDPNSKDNNTMNDGQGGPGYTIEAEFNNKLRHIHGALAAARKGNSSNPMKESSGSQFYIVEDENGAPQLDGEYTVFGLAISGRDVVSTIAEQSKDPRNDRPREDINMTVTIEYLTAEELTNQYNFSIPTE